MDTFRKLSIITVMCGALSACHDHGGGSDPEPPANQAPTASSVSIADDNGGDADIGDSLTGSYSYFDADNDAEGASSFRWLRDGTAIGGATGETYTLTTADAQTDITFEVTPKASSGETNGGAVTSAAIMVNAAPVNEAPNASADISDDNGGSAQVGDNLTGNYNYSDEESDAEGETTFRWLRDGVAIEGATTTSYTLIVDDAETDIIFEVTPVALTGTLIGSAKQSNEITVAAIAVNEAPVASSVSIVDDNGDSTVLGDNLTASYTYSDAENDLEGPSTYRWLRDGATIDGAVSLTYSVTIDDVNTVIGFEVTPIALSGALIGSPVQSSTISVTNTAPVAINVVIIDPSGADAIVGEELQGSYTYSDVEGDPESTSAYRWFKDDVAINGATDSTYTLILDDVGAQISFEVTPVASSGTATGTAVTSDSVLAHMSPPVVTNLARFMDSNQSGVMDAGDRVVIPFDQNLNVNSVGIDDLTLAVTDDQFGAGATVLAGPRANELTITMGTLPKLTVEGDFNENAISSGDASGVDVSDSLAADIIENSTGIDAVTSSPIDLTPGFVFDALYGNSTSYVQRVAIGDLNGDNSPDVVFGMGVFGYIKVMLNNGDGSFSLSTVNGPFGARSNDIALGDIDGDGDLDIVTAGGHISNGAQPLSIVFTNDGTGVFTELQSLGGNGSSVAIGDVNGDGDLDIVLGGNVSNPGAHIYINDINDDGNVGVFTSMGVIDVDYFTEATALADLDNDGDLDLIVGKGNGGGFTEVFQNDGAGNFSALSNFNASNHIYSIDAGDIDGDGFVDLLFGTFGNGRDLVLINDGTGNFTDNGLVLQTITGRQMVLGDVDNDGDLDIVAAGRNDINNDSRFVWINDGSGQFVDSGGMIEADENGQSNGVGMADFDGDGDIDMVVSSDAGIRVFMNSLKAVNTP